MSLNSAIRMSSWRKMAWSTRRRRTEPSSTASRGNASSLSCAPTASLSSRRRLRIEIFRVPTKSSPPAISPRSHRSSGSTTARYSRARCFSVRASCIGILRIAESLSSQPEQLAKRGRPSRKLRAVGVEHGDRQAIHPEGDAAGMSRFTACIPDVPGGAEMVAVVVETHAGGRLVFRAQRNQQFEFEGLLHLADGLHLADAAEERVAGIVDAESEPEITRDRLRPHHPALAEIRHVVRTADADIFPHPEGLQTVQMPRRFAAEAVGGDVETKPAWGQLSPRGCDRVERIAGRRRQHEVGGRQRGGPVAAGIEAADGGIDLALAAMQAADAAEQVGKAL